MFSVTGQYNLWNTNEGDMKELVYINPVTTSIQVAGRCDALVRVFSSLLSTCRLL